MLFVYGDQKDTHVYRNFNNQASCSTNLYPTSKPKPHNWQVELDDCRAVYVYRVGRLHKHYIRRNERRKYIWNFRSSLAICSRCPASINRKEQRK